jgi:hypothetical protein
MEHELHPDLEPLKFLLGDWEGAGVGGYPTIESFRFGQEISFSHIGKPYLIYTSRTWRLDDEGNLGAPLARESGYWRAQPGGRVELVLAHPTGIAEIYIGQATGTRVDLQSDVVDPRAAPAEQGSTGLGRPATGVGCLPGSRRPRPRPVACPHERRRRRDGD